MCTHAAFHKALSREIDAFLLSSCSKLIGVHMCAKIIKKDLCLTTSNLERELMTNYFLWWLYEHVGSLYRYPLPKIVVYVPVHERRRGYKQWNGDCALSNTCFITECARVYSVVLYSVRHITDSTESHADHMDVVLQGWSVSTIRVWMERYAAKICRINRTIATVHRPLPV